MATICSNRHIWRGSCNRTELRTERSCGPNTPTRPFTDRDERRQLIDRTINLWAAGRAFPQENRHRAVRRLALAIGSERLNKRGPRAPKIVEDLERDSRSRHGHSPCRPSKRRDPPSFASGDKLGRNK